VKLSAEPLLFKEQGEEIFLSEKKNGGGLILLLRGEDLLVCF